jgi:hypothetical protein
VPVAWCVLTPESFAVALVPPGERRPPSLGTDDLVEVALLGRVRRVEDRREVEVRVDRLAQAHRLLSMSMVTGPEP